jgi:hypothetical protein
MTHNDPTAASRGPYSNPELNHYAELYGQSGDAYYAPNDPPAWLGGEPERQVPSSQAYQEFYRLDENELRSLQETAFAAGLYGNRERDQIRWDDRDEMTREVWATLVDRSAGYLSTGRQVSPWQALMEAAQHPQAANPDAPRPVQITLPNPDDLRNIFRETARETLGGGRKLDSKLDEMVAKFNEKIAAYQRGQQDPAGGTFVEPPSPQTFAEGYAKRVDPVAYDARKLLDKLDYLSQMLAGQTN